MKKNSNPIEISIYNNTISYENVQNEININKKPPKVKFPDHVNNYYEDDLNN